MTMLPKSSAKADSDNKLSQDALVMFENQGTPVVGVILGFASQKYTVLTEEGAETPLHPNRLHILPGRIPPICKDKREKVSFLASLQESAKEREKNIDLEALWKKICEIRKAYSNSDLCRIAFEKDDLGSHTALRRALIHDTVYFRRDKEFFEPRSATEIEEHKDKALLRKKNLRAQQLLLAAFRERLQGKTSAFPDETAELLHLLELGAVRAAHIGNDDHKTIKEFISSAQEVLPVPFHGRPHEYLCDLLSRVGHFVATTNFSIIRHSIRKEFRSELVLEATHVETPKQLSSYRDSPHRKDLTHVAALTIDDKSTKDMDDALSIETADFGFRLGVHISDVAYLLPVDSMLDREARRRATSIYTPDRTINMLPELLSEDRFSLIQGEVRPCLSFLFDVGRDFHITRGEIVPSIIRVAQRLDYEEANSLIEAHDPVLDTLYQIASTREMERFEKGGFKVAKREMMVVPGQNGELILQEMDENSPSRNLIGEMMILANELAATFCARNNIPALYRSQEARGPDELTPQRVTSGPAAEYAMRAALKPSVTSLTPGKHATLGLDAYLQITSPIRRYVDLLHERQIVHFLTTGTPLYDSKRFAELCSDTEAPLATAAMVNKETRRFWFIRYLEQRMVKNPFVSGTVLRTDQKTPLVELEEIVMPVLVRLPTKYRVGDQVHLKIIRANAAADELRFEVLEK